MKASLLAQGPQELLRLPWSASTGRWIANSKPPDFTYTRAQDEVEHTDHHADTPALRLDLPENAALLSASRKPRLLDHVPR